MSEAKNRRRAAYNEVTSQHIEEHDHSAPAQQDLYGMLKQTQDMVARLELVVGSNLKQTQAVAEQAANQNKGNQDGDTIDLIDLFWSIVSKIHYVAIAAALGLIIAAVYAYGFYEPTYSATSKLYIISGSDSIINLSDLQLGNALGPDYTEVFKTWEVSEMVRSRLGVDYSYNKLQSMLSVSIPTNSRVLYLTVKSKSAQEATDIANAFAEAGKQFIMMSMSTEEPNTFSVALVPGTPSSRGKSFYLVMGFLIGTMLALGVIVLIFLLDNRPRSAEDITKATGLPVLAVIPLVTESTRVNKKHKKSGGKKK